MINLSEQISAYIDGELTPQEAKTVEERLARDPAAKAEMDLLLNADAIAQDQFEAQVHDPIPFALAKQINDADLADPHARSARPIWGALAASLVALMIGGFGGYVIKGVSTPVETAGWLRVVADYHGIYADQKRHLVEVGADESEHIQAWLGKTVGVEFSIPDLSEHTLIFEGARLVVANGKPVAQLMYRQPDGAVIALCLQRGNETADAAVVFKEQTINGFDFISWSTAGADYVIIGEEGQPDLLAIAASAEMDV